MYEFKELDTAFFEIARIAQVFGVAYAENIIEATESLAYSEEAEAMSRIMREIMGLESEKEATIVLLKKCQRREWREATRYARERERAQAHTA